MRKNRLMRVLSLILAVGLILSLTACGGGDSQSTTAASKAESGTTAAEADGKEDETTKADTSGVETKALNNRDENGDYVGPLCEEKTTLRVFSTGTQFTQETFSTEAITNNPAYTYLEEQTNIHLDFIVPTSGEEVNQFNLMVASGNYPDIITMSSSMVYPGDIDQALEDGAFFDMTDYAEEWMPNYYGIITANDDIYKETTTLNGRIGGVWVIYDAEVPGKILQWWGAITRQDYLDAVGLEIPETVDEWETLLTAYKEQLGVEIPYSMINTTGVDTGFANAYGMIAAPLNSTGSAAQYYQVDGQITWGGIEDVYKEYLTMMNRWYANGLLDQEFMTRAWTSARDTIYAMWGEGQIGTCYIVDGPYALYVNALKGVSPDAEVVAAPCPSLEKGTKTVVNAGRYYTYSGSQYVISAECEDPYLCMNFLDYMCSPKGSMLANFGIEGESYTYVDGVPTYTDLVLNNSVSARNGVWTNCVGAFVIVGMESVRNLQYKDATLNAIDQMWTETTEQSTTIYSLTSDETTEAAALMGDILTYFQEKTISAIISDEGLADWDNVVQKMYDMGIQDVIDIYQTGYERYNNR